MARVRTAAKIARYVSSHGYARVATGDLDLVIENKLMPHDIDAWSRWCAGGGRRRLDGGEDFSRGRVIGASSHALYDEAVALLAG